MRKIDIVASVDGGSRFLHFVVESRQLVDGGVVAHDHTVEAQVATKDVGENLAVGHAVGAVDSMVAWHDGFASRQTNHGFVWQQNLLHQFLLVGISSSAIAQIVLRAGSHALLEVALLQSLDECRTHHGREVGVFAIRLFEAVEAGCAAHIHHR